MFTYISNQDRKIFGIGLSRTGTTSLHMALSHLGFKDIHWLVHQEGRMATLEDAYFCDAMTDITASFIFETLYFTFPNAKFIYTERAIGKWVKSIQRHYGMKTPKDLQAALETAPVVFNSSLRIPQHRTVLFKAIHHGLYSEHKSWRDAYKAHEERVLHFFENKPEDRFLRMNFEKETNAWAKLGKFLDVKVPKGEFPRISEKHEPIVGDPIYPVQKDEADT